MMREIEIQSVPERESGPLEIAVVHRSVRHEVPVLVLRAPAPERERLPRPAWLLDFVAA
jgi:hypothetical protein